MISDNGDDPRIIRMANGLLPTDKQRRSKPMTVGEAEDFLERKSEEIFVFFNNQIPAIVNAMFQGAFAAYDQGRREAFDEIMTGLSRDGMAPEVSDAFDRLQHVFGVPIPHSDGDPQ